MASSRLKLRSDRSVPPVALAKSNAKTARNNPRVVAPVLSKKVNSKVTDSTLGTVSIKLGKRIGTSDKQTSVPPSSSVVNESNTLVRHSTRINHSSPAHSSSTHEKEPEQLVHQSQKQKQKQINSISTLQGDKGIIKNQKKDSSATHAVEINRLVKIKLAVTNKTNHLPKKPPSKSISSLHIETKKLKTPTTIRLTSPILQKAKEEQPIVSTQKTNSNESAPGLKLNLLKQKLLESQQQKLSPIVPRKLSLKFKSNGSRRGGSVSDASTEIIDSQNNSSALTFTTLMEANRYILHLFQNQLEDRYVIFQSLPSKRHFPYYYTVVKKPISFNCIERHINQGLIISITDLVDAYNLLFNNAMLFNEPGSVVYIDASNMRQSLTDLKNTGLNISGKLKPNYIKEQHEDLSLPVDSQRKKRKKDTQEESHISIGNISKRKESDISKVRNKNKVDVVENGSLLPVDQSPQISTHTGLHKTPRIYTKLARHDVAELFHSIKTDDISKLRSILSRHRGADLEKSYETDILGDGVKSQIGFLHAAAYWGSLECMGYLLEQPTSHAESASTDKNKLLQVVDWTFESTPLGWAAFHDELTAGKYLLVKGARVDVTNKHGTSIAGLVPVNTLYKSEWKNLLERGATLQDSALKNRMTIFLEDYLILANRKNDNSLLCELFMALPSREDYPSYYQVISDPICLNMILAKNKTGKYSTFESLYSDLQLLVQNAITFNEPGSDLVRDAEYILHIADLWLPRLPISKLKQSPSSSKISTLSTDKHGTTKDGMISSKLPISTPEKLGRHQLFVGGVLTAVFPSASELRSVREANTLDSITLDLSSNEPSSPPSTEKKLEVIRPGDTYLLRNKIPLESSNSDILELESIPALQSLPSILFIQRIWSLPAAYSVTSKPLILFSGSWYLHPHQTYHLPTRKFYENEVFQTTNRHEHSESELLRRCAVLSLSEYRKGFPMYIPLEDTFVCEFRYSEGNQTFSRIKDWPLRYVLPKTPPEDETDILSKEENRIKTLRPWDMPPNLSVRTVRSVFYNSSKSTLTSNKPLPQTQLPMAANRLQDHQIKAFQAQQQAIFLKNKHLQQQPSDLTTHISSMGQSGRIQPGSRPGSNLSRQTVTNIRPTSLSPGLFYNQQVPVGPLLTATAGPSTSHITSFLNAGGNLGNAPAVGQNFPYYPSQAYPSHPVTGILPGYIPSSSAPVSSMSSLSPPPLASLSSTSSLSAAASAQHRLESSNYRRPAVSAVPRIIPSSTGIVDVDGSLLASITLCSQDRMDALESTVNVPGTITTTIGSYDVNNESFSYGDQANLGKKFWEFVIFGPAFQRQFLNHPGSSNFIDAGNTRDINISYNSSSHFQPQIKHFFAETLYVPFNLEIIYLHICLGRQVPLDKNSSFSRTNIGSGIVIDELYDHRSKLDDNVKLTPLIYADRIRLFPLDISAKNSMNAALMKMVYSTYRSISSDSAVSISPILQPTNQDFDLADSSFCFKLNFGALLNSLSGVNPSTSLPNNGRLVVVDIFAMPSGMTKPVHAEEAVTLVKTLYIYRL